MNYVTHAGVLLLLLGNQVLAHDNRREDGSWQGHIAQAPRWYEVLQHFVISPVDAAARISIEGDYRVIRSDGKPDHITGTFPNRNNPNRIHARSKTYRVPLKPVYKAKTFALGLWPFGVAINGVPFDPGAAEFWRRDPNSGWQYEALGGAVNLGVDTNNAHVQPDGTYHYHGLPTALLDQFVQQGRPALIGYAADGFPIYGPLGYRVAKDHRSELIELQSSYQIKEGLREGGPGGRHDGAFVQDYRYVKGLGDLDDCNGRFGVTPEHPEGTYHYVITGKFPFIPRCFHGEPDRSFIRGGPREMVPLGSTQGLGGRSGISNAMPRNNRIGVKPGQPPEEAFTACLGKRSGESVSFMTPHGHKISGRCQQHSDGRIFAIPQR